MKIQMFVGASGAYARIRQDGIDVSVLLSDKMSCADSLVLSAQEMREKAQRMLRRAEIIEEAARHLANETQEA